MNLDTISPTTEDTLTEIHDILSKFSKIHEAILHPSKGQTIPIFNDPPEPPDCREHVIDLKYLEGKVERIIRSLSGDDEFFIRLKHYNEALKEAIQRLKKICETRLRDEEYSGQEDIGDYEKALEKLQTSGDQVNNLIIDEELGLSLLCIAIS